MATISDAVALNRVSRVIGYRLRAGVFREVTPNLPQRIGIVASANVANQATLNTTPRQITNAQQAGQLYGFGSPIYSIARILFPVTGTGVSGIPVYVHPVEDTALSVAAESKIAVTAAAVTGNAIHTVIIGGRDNVDGQNYSFEVVTTDDADSIALKIVAVINSVIGCPVTAAINGILANEIDLTTKFAGVVSNQVSFAVRTENAVGVVYAVTNTTPGSVVHNINPALALLGEAWTTVLVNGFDETKMADFETVNGVPDPDNPTGRYQAIEFKPFFAFTGNISDDITADIVPTITGVAARKTQVTNVLAVAPNSTGTLYEAAANMAFLTASIFETSPHLDTAGRSYPDMPIPVDRNIGEFAVYDNRDFAAKNGCSTVTIKNDKYQVEDSITTYHPDGELLPAFRFVRNLMIDFNFKFGYTLILEANVRDKAIVGSDQTVLVDNVIKPKQLIQLLYSYADTLATRALIADPQFMKDNIQVQTGDTNPDRLEATIKYKRSAFNRITSTDAEAGFIFNLI